MSLQTTPIRMNVLILVGIGYLSLLIMFGAMVWPGGMDAESAYEVVKGPLMALIGGSLAISKDLIPLGDKENKSNKQESSSQGPVNKQRRTNKEDGSHSTTTG